MYVCVYVLFLQGIVGAVTAVTAVRGCLLPPHYRRGPTFPNLNGGREPPPPRPNGSSAARLTLSARPRTQSDIQCTPQRLVA